MSKHTNGPWRIVEDRTHGSLEVFSEDTAIAEMWRRGNKTLEMANARRIVACINSCEGFSTEELESANLFGESVAAKYEAIALRQQRDELLAALTRLEFAAQCRDNTSGDPCRLMVVKAELAAAAEQARAAIAKAGGDTPQKCKCNFRQKTVGDGCAICNPELAADTKDGGESWHRSACSWSHTCRSRS